MLEGTPYDIPDGYARQSNHQTAKLPSTQYNSRSSNLTPSDTPTSASRNQRRKFMPLFSRVVVLLSILNLLFAPSRLPAADSLRRVTLLRTIPADEARQAVAVDSQFVYAIDNHRIGKYAKSDGRKVGSGEYSALGIIHLNSGVIVSGRLVCAHSNYPRVPMASSLEIFDPKTLRHVGSHSFGSAYGSLTWVDFHQGLWWLCFAHYEGKGGEPGKGPEWSTVVAFDTSWVHKGTWLFPPEVVERFRPHSCSGGCWVSPTLFLCTGHDRPELYMLEIPPAGSYLRLRGILNSPNPGQGIAVDPCDRTILYGIDRQRRAILVMRLE